MLIAKDLLQVRTALVCFYVLRDEQGLYLIDTGFVGGKRSLQRALKEYGWEELPILGVLLTHGHLDHIFNVRPIIEESGAWVAGSEADLAHFEGKASYSGVGKGVGWLEEMAKRIFGFEPFAPDRFLREGDLLEIWGGLEVISLPGHTRGHVGFYSASRRLIFCGDLFASMERFSHLPPLFFNEDSAQNVGSIERVLALELNGVCPHHCDSASVEEHLIALRSVFSRANQT